MQNILHIGDITRVHLASPTQDEVLELEKIYDLHELVIEDLLELNSQDKADVYDDHVSIALHFPKYDITSKRYLMNELNVVLGSKYIISTTRFAINTISKMRSQYIQKIKDLDEDEDFKITPYYILHQLINSLYIKNLTLLTKVTRDIIKLEEDLFGKKDMNNSIVSDLLIKKRNITFLKHCFGGHHEVLEDMNQLIPSFYENYQEDTDVYFEDLTSIANKISSNIGVLQENIDSIAETYNALMSIKTNNTILLLTMFTGLMLPLTLLTGMYGMNVPMPFQQSIYVFWVIFFILIIIGVFFVYFIYRNRS